MNKAQEEIFNRHIEVMLNEFPDMGRHSAESFIEKAIMSKEIKSISNEDISHWYTKVFKEYMFAIDEKTYLEASIQALKIQFSIAATDFGSSRQRDLGQKWSDTIRGYLGEFGVKQVFEKFNVKIDLGHEEGELSEYLPQDIHAVKLQNDENFRAPNLKVSIKTTKSNGIWLDIPGDQFNHSDIYILAKIGIGTDHLFSFFKHISVFKDKILKCGKDEGCLSEAEADEIYEKVPSFHCIYGYIPGFIEYDEKYAHFKYEGKKGKKNFSIYDWTGKYEKEFLKVVAESEKLEANAKVDFLGIGQFSQSNRFIFGMKSLRNTPDEWAKYILQKL